jgi:probable HAF family extracellular repeat protein
MVRSETMKICRFLVPALLLGTLFVQSASAATRYQVTEIPTFGGDFSTAAAINEQGHVTGTAWFRRDRSGIDAHAYLYAGGTMLDLGNDAVPRNDEHVNSVSDGRAINSSDQVAGDELGRGGDPFPVLFTPAPVEFRLPEWFQVIARGINEAGDVVGGSTFGGPGFLYHAGVITSLPGTLSIGYDVNNRGVVVGVGKLSSGAPFGPFVLRGGVYTQLASTGVAEAVNDRGEIVGYTADFGTPQAFRVDPGSTDLVPLAPLAGDVQTQANAVSERGVVAGWSGNNGEHRAVIWKGRRVLNLNAHLAADSGWFLQEATGVNRAGQIVGNGLLHGQPRGFLLTPVTS